MILRLSDKEIKKYYSGTLISDIHALLDAQIKAYQDYYANMTDEEMVEEWAKMIYSFTHRGKVHMVWNNLPNKYGKDDYLKFARQLLALSQTHELKAVEEAKKNILSKMNQRDVGGEYPEWSLSDKDYQALRGKGDNNG